MQQQEEIKKSVYTFRSEKGTNICISFELESPAIEENIRDAEAEDFLYGLVGTNACNFYMDDCSVFY